ncbi:MAG: DUF2779 domain-containing protein [Spirochaetota bacterium]
MSFPTVSLPRPLEAGELATGLVCKRHLYLAYHGLLEKAGGEVWEDDGRYFDRQRRLTREAYYAPMSPRRGEWPAILEHPLLRVEVAGLEKQGSTTNITVVTSAMSVKRSALLEAAGAIWILRQKSEDPPETAVTLVYLNRNYTPEEPEAPLFNEEDVSYQAAAMAGEIGERLAEFASYLQRAPEAVRGDSYRCARPDRCPACSAGVDAQGEESIFTLFRGREKVLPLFERGIRRLRDIPPDYALGRRQRIQMESHLTSTIHIELEPLRAFREKLVYPLGFLDFEAVQEAVPRVPLAKPWQHLPFLFSLHTSSPEQRGLGVSSQVAYLCREGLESLETMARILAEALEGVGSVVVYNREMEARSLRYLAQRFPYLGDVLEEAAERIVDLYLLFQAFALYHPRQQGSLSLKSVLPAFTGIDYAGRRFQDGRSASLAYYWAHLDDRTPVGSQDRQWIDDELERYCSLDTFGLLKLLDAMEGLLERAERTDPTQRVGPVSVVSLEPIAE